MRKTYVAVTVFLVFIIVASLFTVLASISDPYNIKTTGTISPSRGPPIPSAGYQDNATHQFLIRGPWIGDQTSAADVDTFVANNPYGTGVMLGDGSYDIVNVISYTGWNASRHWVPQVGSHDESGITYGQLKAVIDRFHYYGWKVILISATQIAEWADAWSTDYYTLQHPELIAVNGLGQRYDDVSPGNLRVNFFANYTTADTAWNITVGQRLIDVYCQRLSRMISDGGLVWDGWFGADGWTGLTNDGMVWLMQNAASYAVYGTNIGALYANQWYWGDEQSLNEWGNSSYGSLIPAGNFQSTVGTFGNSADGVYDVLSMDSSHIYADRYQATYSGNMASISVHTGGTVSCQVFVYSDNSGRPNALLGYGSGTSQNGAYAPITLTTQAAVTSGSYYWIAVQPSVNLGMVYNASATSVWSVNASNTYGNYPSTFPTPTYGNCSMDIYATVSQYNNWTSMSSIQKSYWVQNNANVEWWQYWQVRFAKMFAEINAVFNQRPSDYKVGTMIATDLSSAISGSGINCPVGMVNMTAFAEYDSFNHCQASDEETYNTQTKDEAYAVGLSTYGMNASQVPDIHTIIEVDISNWGQPYPEWMGKQKYLSAAQSYVWVNGTRYRGCDPNWVVLFMDNTAAEQAQATDLTSWITSVANVLASANPTYLGPVLDIPLSVSTSSDPFKVNYAFAQFAQDLTLNSTGFSQSMGTIFLDATAYAGSTLSKATSSGLLQMFANGSIDIIYGGVGTYWSNVFMGNNESQAESTFKLTYSSGGVSTATTLSSGQVTDAFARAIIGSTFGETYTLSNAGIYMNGTGFIPLIQYVDGKTLLGIFYNSTSGRFVYTNTLNPPTGDAIVDQGVLNRAIDWASHDPITVNDSLADAKIFTFSNGSIAISMMNLDTYNTSLPITLNLTGLGLSGSYTGSWVSNGSTVDLSNLGSVNTTLQGGADVLVLNHI